MDKDPEIVINGTTLTEAQAMTVRVACASMLMNTEFEGLGDDEHGRRMAALYIKRLREIFATMKS